MASNPKSLGNRVGSLQCDNTTLHLLKANDFVANAIRQRLKNVCVINVCSSPGSGKTTLMQETGKRLGKDLNIAVLVGDPETDRDAVRMKEVGLNALQIVTGGMCHIEAQMILQALDHIELENLDLLFIENVGNLLCPSAFDLGEDYRVTLLATTEGDDKPKKYPRMFLTSELMLVSKADLLPYVPFTVENVTQDAREVNPNIEILTISTLNGEGIDAWCEWLQARVAAKKAQIAE
ncbi:hydrogenase nickel incorporation protein HypB [Myroides odoratus]|jgi:hydrogenase nickel incorporation protein HypB|uniref:Hydrogenase nickel incorporation protein HypB n=1 Tax=Myroides odoratus TaxID=256 RepID=A0A9Q7EA77_MYROD|nr:hydrogenase nickel incorporation protein HypB [Myroides odoratus]EHQ44445.1 hydrogenase accessory protein HypB [Myroides odoratus DSM 2801]EKB03744.1 hydrogenase accessory protein HypB [Myroides odoratus CIP 103059]QQU01713.1 hydrogenase nickel incorporation protein HypB [Myroides odoratus]WQD56004.1 hydrogenase nickel incorporation protein HypB [Myroides odoratus]STZ31784.1 Hydrogenase isoenzymes nickel incorporation protein hypB [Myroides odoratus]